MTGRSIFLCFSEMWPTFCWGTKKDIADYHKYSRVYCTLYISSAPQSLLEHKSEQMLMCPSAFPFSSRSDDAALGPMGVYPRLQIDSNIISLQILPDENKQPVTHLLTGYESSASLKKIKLNKILVY